MGKTCDADGICAGGERDEVLGCSYCSRTGGRAAYGGRGEQIRRNGCDPDGNALFAVTPHPGSRMERVEHADEIVNMLDTSAKRYRRRSPNVLRTTSLNGKEKEKMVSSRRPQAPYARDRRNKLGTARW